MAPDQGQPIVVTGATGLQGGAVSRQLLAQGWRVRALTRNPRSPKAKALAALGAEVVQGDMADPASLAPIFRDAYGVFSVQNPMLAGVEAEVQQGKNVADAAKKAGVRHMVYGSAGTGARNTGVPSWESKLRVEEHIQRLGLPITVLRPMAFMDLMSEKKFYPPVSVWHIMPALMGSATPIVWLSAADLGIIAAKAFAEPGRFIGQDLKLLSDVKSIDDCRQLYQEVMGRKPPRFPMPPQVFERFGFMGRDLVTMWRWLRTGELPLDTGPTFAIHPQAATVRDWLKTQRH